MKHIYIRCIALCTLLCMLLSVTVLGAFADQQQNDVSITQETQDTATQPAETDSPATSQTAVKTAKAWSAGIAIGVVCAVGALSMGFVVMKTVSGIARQPEAAESIRSGMMLGLVFIETAIIYALIVAILIVFVL